MEKDPNVTNHILQPSNSKMYGKGPGYNEHILSAACHFVIPGFQEVWFDHSKRLTFNIYQFCIIVPVLSS